MPDDPLHFVPEDQCSICAHWPAALRPAMRQALLNIPLREPICAGCTVAFFRNIGFPVEDAPTRH